MNLKNVRRASLAGAATAAIALGAGLFAAPAQASVAPANTWDKLAQCESGGNWGINTGNGYSGGLQFTPSTWKAYGGKGAAHNASKAEQIRVAKKVQAGQGWGAWPACSAKIGLRGSAGVSDGATSAGTKTSGTKSTAKSYKSYSSKSSTSKYTTKKSTYSSAKSSSTPVKSSYAKQSTGYTAKATAPVAKPAALTLPKNVKDSGKNITVKSGDTLFKIAERAGLDSWLSLYALNQDTISNPDLIFVGAELNVPTK